MRPCAPRDTSPEHADAVACGPDRALTLKD